MPRRQCWYRRIRHENEHVGGESVSILFSLCVHLGIFARGHCIITCMAYVTPLYLLILNLLAFVMTVNNTCIIIVYCSLCWQDGRRSALLLGGVKVSAQMILRRWYKCWLGWTVMRSGETDIGTIMLKCFTLGVVRTKVNFVSSIWVSSPQVE